MSPGWEALPAAGVFVLLLLVGGSVLVSSILSSRRERGALSTILEVVPERLGLTVTDRKDWQVEGTLDGVKVLLEHRTRDWSRVEVMVSDYGQIPVSLFLHKRGSHREKAYPPEQAWRTGDVPFDEQVVLYGDRVDVAISMTPRAREAALHGVGELDCWISNSSVLCEVDDARVDPDLLVQRIPEMIELLRALTAPQESAGHLAALLPDETCPDMAGLVAEVLFTRHPEGRKSRVAAETLHGHPSGRARLFASMRLLAAGSGQLAMLADGGRDERDERVFRLALKWAGDELEPALVASAALEALRLDDVELLAVAIEVLGRHGPLESVGPLHRLADRRRLPDALRRSAREAMERVRVFHHGEEADGGLELAELKPREGGLELADGPADGGLELAPEVSDTYT